MTEPELEELEKKLFRSLNEDGFLEMVVGLLLLVTGLGLALDGWGVADAVRISVTVPLMFSGVLVIYLGKKYVTVPRIGVVKFSKNRMEGRRRLFMYMTASILAMNAVTLAIVMGGWEPVAGGEYSRALTEGIVLSIILLIFGTLAYFLSYPRLLAAGIVFASAELAYWLSGSGGESILPGLLIYCTAGALVIAMGLHALRNFVLRYPVPAGG